MERKMNESNEKMKVLQSELRKSQKFAKELPNKDRVRMGSSKKGGKTVARFSYGPVTVPHRHNGKAKTDNAGKDWSKMI
jgi:hypothetical protein